MLTAALDVGGTKIAYGLIDDASPTEVFNRGRIPAGKNGPDTVNQMREALRNILTEDVVRIGIGVPGIVSAPEGIVLSAGPTLPGWVGLNLREELADFDVPTAFLNDVRCLGYSQTVQADSVKRTLFVSLGTGVGGALLDHGQLIDTETFSAGEISGLIVPDFQCRAVRCEDSVSGTGLTAYYNCLAQGKEVSFTLPTDTDIRLPEIIQRWQAGEQLATEVIEGNLRGFGQGLGAFVSALDIRQVVIGGGVASIGEELIELIRSGFQDTALPPNKSVPLARARFQDDAPLIGAAAYAVDHAY